MKRQTRPFIVEVKQKRGSRKPNRSIWGGLDLSAVTAETTREAKALEVPDRQLIDSDMAPGDAVDGNKHQREYLMAEPQETEAAQSVTETPAKVETAEVKKKAPRQKRVAKVQPKRPAAKNVAKAAVSESITPAPAKGTRKVYSAKERAQILGQIEKTISRGDSIKSATKQAGVSEQTYYQWKKAAASTSDSGDLKDLVALEEENQRLKKQLAEHLRKENAELKRKLGLS